MKRRGICAKEGFSAFILGVLAARRLPFIPKLQTGRAEARENGGSWGAPALKFASPEAGYAQLMRDSSTGAARWEACQMAKKRFSIWARELYVL